MNINSLMFTNPITPKRVDNSLSRNNQTSFTSLKVENNQAPAEPAKNMFTFIQKMQDGPKNVEFLRFMIPQVFPYPAIKGVFIPNKETVPMEIPGEPAIVRSGSVDLPCWFIPPQPGKPTVLWCHGNNENITKTQVVAKQLTAEGNGIMMVEYEGYGNAKGTPSEQKCYQNAIDAAKYLNTQKGIPNSQIVVMGHSLGGPIAAHTAASVSEQDAFKGLVLDSTVPDMAVLVKSWIDNDYLAQVSEPKENYPLERVRQDLATGGGLFPTEQFIPNIPKSTKILVVHSSKDNVVDGYVGKQLMQIVKAYRPDAITQWESESSLSHQNYECRMPAVASFVSMPSFNRLV
jgi:predicted esterase